MKQKVFQCDGAGRWDGGGVTFEDCVIWVEGPSTILSGNRSH